MFQVLLKACRRAISPEGFIFFQHGETRRSFCGESSFASGEANSQVRPVALWQEVIPGDQEEEHHRWP